ncbi:MAG: BNR repeat-containing protein [Pirellulaceae bacterium]
MTDNKKDSRPRIQSPSIHRRQDMPSNRLRLMRDTCRTIILALALAFSTTVLARAQEPPDASKNKERVEGINVSIINAFTIDDQAFEWNWGAWDQEKIISFGQFQYTVYWAKDGSLAIGRRNLDSNETQHIYLSQYKLSKNDRHRNTCLGVSRDDGRLHVSFDHHNDPLRYLKSKADFLTHPPAVMTADDFEAAQPMLDDPALEESVTYPRFIMDRDGILFFYYRNGGSGNGDNFLHRYDPASGTWTRIGMVASRRGTYPDWETSTSRNAYFQDIRFDDNNRLHAIWVYRETSRTWASNHDLHYAFSDDRGITWKNNQGDQIADLPNGDPIELSDPGLVVVDIPVYSWLMNAGPMNFDSQNRPHLVTYKAREVQTREPVVHDPSQKVLDQLVFVHYWRDDDGTFRGGAAIPPDQDGVCRGDLVFDADDNLIYFYPTPAGIKYYWSAADDQWKTFHGPYALTHSEFTAPQRNSTKHDIVRWKTQGILSFTAQPQSGGFAILDFKIEK